jgi:hypothetical protein
MVRPTRSSARCVAGMQGRETTQGSAAGAYGEPCRLYNLDVFEYEIDEPMAL